MRRKPVGCRLGRRPNRSWKVTGQRRVQRRSAVAGKAGALGARVTNMGEEAGPGSWAAELEVSGMNSGFSA